ncbi:unnamed protein product [Dibothriocephalus latus]|uniref:Uncharacterized protein n=1 Tax=Dibothriocephalus latus TaxID=60516 RepID=A0A3P7MKJ1_DIBLA|nr:unnamed protein product [Dibothriocephalus latus]
MQKVPLHEIPAAEAPAAAPVEYVEAVVQQLPDFPVPDSGSDKERPAGVVELPRLPVVDRGTPLSVEEVRGGEPSDALNKERRNKVKDVSFSFGIKVSIDIT